MTKKERSWILYDVANSAFSVVMMTAILPIFFKSFAAKGVSTAQSTAYWGYGNTIASLFVAFLAPILGTIADYRDVKKKFLIFFISVGVIFTLSISMIQEGQWLQCIILYIFSVIGFSGANVFYDAFLVDVTTDKRMDWVSSSGFAWGYVGSLVPFGLSIAFITLAPKFDISNIFATKVAFGITGLWWLLLSIPIMKNVSQNYYIEREPQAIKKSFARLAKTFGNIKQYKNAFLFLLAYFFYIDGVSTMIKMSGAYAIDIGVDSTTLLIIFAAIQLVAWPFAILYGKLVKKFKTKPLLYFAIFTYMVVSIYAFFIKTVIDYWILAMLVASAQGGIQALSRSAFGKIIPKENASEFFGFYNIFGKFAAILGPFLMAIVSDITDSSRYGIFSIIFLFIIGFVLLTKVDLNEKEPKIEEV